VRRKCGVKRIGAVILTSTCHKGKTGPYECRSRSWVPNKTRWRIVAETIARSTADLPACAEGSGNSHLNLPGAHAVSAPTHSTCFR